MGQIWEQTQTFWFHFLLDVGTFVERLLVYCFDITLAYPEAGPEDGYEAEAVLLLHTSHSLTAPQRTTVI
jgi:hypothetical protein